jgi:ABC-type sugar transport system ATPase subunit
MHVQFEHVKRSYGEVDALADFHLTVASGEFLVLLGPSGCGKSTALRLLAGLDQPTAGRLLMGERDITYVSPQERDIALVFQNYALYPHLTVEENIAYPLRRRRVPASERRTRIREAAEMVGIGAFLARKPRELSGGQRQRVALARSIVRSPSAFLMDEPLSNLDARLRAQMRAELRRLQKQLGTTTIFVTHDQLEAMMMADTVAVVNEGAIEQVGSPEAIYAEPSSVFVATFVGAPPMNVVDAHVSDGQLVVGGRAWPLPADAAVRLAEAAGGRPFKLGAFPEHVGVAPAQAAPDAGPLGTVELVQPFDLTSRLVTVRVGEERIVARVDHRTDCEPGAALALVVEPARIHAFDAAHGRRLHGTWSHVGAHAPAHREEQA